MLRNVVQSILPPIALKVKRKAGFASYTPPFYCHLLSLPYTTVAKNFFRRVPCT
jgi:hypothetical protein